jgi:elongator complex protein 3
MKNQGVDCNCIRCREAKEAFSTKGAVFKKIVYKSSGGTEYFLSFEHKQKKLLFGFCRLYINKTSPISPVIIRELHVYGELMPMGQGKKVQHRGLGKKLIAAAELIAKKEKCANIAIISGIGVRPYYRKMGYSLKNTYLIKKLYPTPKQ